MEVDIPEVLSELTAVFELYEKALTGATLGYFEQPVLGKPFSRAVRHA